MKAERSERTQVPAADVVRELSYVAAADSESERTCPHCGASGRGGSFSDPSYCWKCYRRLD